MKEWKTERKKKERLNEKERKKERLNNRERKKERNCKID